jgi:vacuolar-type H+-ATPase subunit E/Vma4
LRDSFKGKAEVFADREISGGFKVNISGDDLFYDFSNEAIVELLASYVTPRVAALLK